MDICYTAPEDAVDEMTGKNVKHDKDQFSNAGAPHIGNHHVRQQRRVPGFKTALLHFG